MGRRATPTTIISPPLVFKDVRYSSKHLTYITSFHPHNKPVKKLL